MSYKKTFSILIIIFIAICAFLAGIVQTPYLEQVQSTEKEISALQYQLEKTRDLSRQVITSDRISLAQAEEMTQKAREAANQYYVLTVLNTSDTLTAEENDAYIYRIGEQLYQRNLWVEATYINTINEEFIAFPNEDYYFADKETVGFDLIIDPDVWETYIPIQSVDTTTFLSENFFPSNVISSVFNYLYTPSSMVIANITLLNYVFANVTYKIQQQIERLEDDYYQDKTTADRLSMGAIIITVTMILASAMSNRLQDKGTEYNFSLLKGDVLKTEEVIVTKRDWISIPVLLLSALLASIGVLIPLILPYFL